MPMPNETPPITTEATAAMGLEAISKVAPAKESPQRKYLRIRNKQIEEQNFYYTVKDLEKIELQKLLRLLKKVC